MAMYGFALNGTDVPDAIRLQFKSKRQIFECEGCARYTIATYPENDDRMELLRLCCQCGGPRKFRPVEGKFASFAGIATSEQSRFDASLILQATRRNYWLQRTSPSDLIIGIYAAYIL